jgi:predicted 3-demethylubiquinone-9 3-methyltransferase (glyoxalase superfamily)
MLAHRASNPPYKTSAPQMTQKITPCLWFEANNALEAAEFYVGVFPNASIDKVLNATTDYPGGKVGQVLFVEFTIAGQSYQALNGGPHATFNDAISLSVLCEDQAEVDRLWSALTADGGKHVQCGWIKDKFGVSWQIVPRRYIELMYDPDIAVVKRVMAAMMEMTKLDVTALEAAARQSD